MALRAVRIGLPAATGLFLLATAACHRNTPAHVPAPDGQPSAQADDARPRGTRASGTAVTSEELRNRKVARAEELLEGRFAGVVVLRNASGGITVRIRGTNTILGGSEPLYVVDGMPIEAAPGGALVGINPADIARIEVLKDIGSTSFYGVRGANGVVLITTKLPGRRSAPGGGSASGS